jgi:hypothetical protein
VKCDLISNKHATVIKLGTRILNVLCQFELKDYTALHSMYFFR